MYHLIIISEDSGRLQFCKDSLAAQQYLVSALGWRDLEGQIELLRKSDLVIADLSGGEALSLFSQLQREIKLYELEICLLLLLAPNLLSQLADSDAYDDFLIREGEPALLRKELAARVRLLLKKQGKGPHQRLIRVKELVLDPDKYEVRKAGQAIALTFKEYELLKYLITHPERVFSRESLLSAVWGYDYYGGTRTVDVHIRRIRSKLADEQENYIKTIWGVGYRFAGGQ